MYSREIEVHFPELWSARFGSLVVELLIALEVD